MKKLLDEWKTAIALILTIITALILIAFGISVILLSFRLFSNICH